MNILKSKAVWLNVVTLLIGVISLSQGMPQFQEFAPWLVFINGVLNLILRIFFTSQPITQYAAKNDDANE